MNEAILKQITNNYTKAKGYGYIVYFKEQLKEVVKKLKEFYNVVKIRKDNQFYCIEFEGLK